MNARAAQRAGNKQAKASRHSHAHPLSRVELQRQVEQQQREIEKLREQVVERDQRIADAQKRIADAQKRIADAQKQMLDAEKQIADLERQLATRKKNSTNSSKPPSSDGMAALCARHAVGGRRLGRIGGILLARGES